MLRYILRQNYSKDMVGSVLGIQKGGRKDGSGSSSGMMTLPLLCHCYLQKFHVLKPLIMVCRAIKSSKQLPCKYELENEVMVLYDFALCLAEFLDEIHFTFMQICVWKPAKYTTC